MNWNGHCGLGRRTDRRIPLQWKWGLIRNAENQRNVWLCVNKFLDRPHVDYKISRKFRNLHNRPKLKSNKNRPKTTGWLSAPFEKLIINFVANSRRSGSPQSQTYLSAQHNKWLAVLTFVSSHQTDHQLKITPKVFLSWRFTVHSGNC